MDGRSATTIRYDEVAPRLASMIVSSKAVIDRAIEASFGSPLIVNSLRAIVVEAMVAIALEPNWRWCSGDWAGWDFEHEDGTRLEVKQSAAKQSWSMLPKKPITPRFDIATRTGYWENGAVWIPQVARHAHLYVFGFHPLKDETADHRQPDQWQFFIVPTLRLPDAKSISLALLTTLVRAVAIADLRDAVENARKGVTK